MNLKDNIKAFLFDIDGTLINRKLEMSPNLLNALHILKDKGYHLSINTGRPPFSTKKIVEKFNCYDLFDYYFCSNGIEIYDVKNDSTTVLANIDDDIMANLSNYFYEDYLSFCAYDGNEYLLFNHYPDNKDNLLEWCKIRYANYKLYDFNSKEKKFHKAAVLFAKEHKEDIDKKLIELNIDSVDYFFSAIDALEFVPKGFNKGKSVTSYAKILNINEKEIMAVGDAGNDLPALIKGTGLLVGDNLKYNDDDLYHCKDVNEDGLYFFLKDAGFLD